MSYQHHHLQQEELYIAEYLPVQRLVEGVKLAKQKRRQGKK
jgi:hypothetical protein